MWNKVTLSEKLSEPVSVTVAVTFSVRVCEILVVGGSIVVVRLPEAVKVFVATCVELTVALSIDTEKLELACEKGRHPH